MTTNRPLNVFLCHSSADKPAVRELYQQLRAEPWIQPWLDEENLFPGMDWNLEIEKAVEMKAGKNNMSPVKKEEPFLPLIDRNEAVDLFNLLLFKEKYLETAKNAGVGKEDRERFFINKYLEIERDFKKKYDHSNVKSMLGVSVIKIEQEYSELVTFFHRIFSEVNVVSKNIPPEAIFEYYINLIKQSETQPVIIGKRYGFKGFYYSVKGHYTDDEIRLLILEEFDKERRLFEKLKAKFDEAASEELSYDRPRIPEKIRIEVWRRDGGKCARCGSREKLEYDHIVPISKGGSNTARNIELLCEKCNRSKSNNVV